VGALALDAAARHHAPSLLGSSYKPAQSGSHVAASQPKVTPHGGPSKPRYRASRGPTDAEAAGWSRARPESAQPLTSPRPLGSDLGRPFLWLALGGFKL